MAAIGKTCWNGGALLALTLIGAAALAGCARQPRLPFRYDAEGFPVQDKRFERHVQRDFFHHFSRTVYDPVTPPPYGYQGDKQTVYEQWGLPDYERREFKSINGEEVDEWLYLPENRIFQFIGDVMVYDGPLTDYEQILLRRGYPSRCEVQMTDTGTRIDVFVYDGVFQPMLEEYHFQNGYLTQFQEGR
ncbi:MAG TPA: hypothetical protein PLS90_12165 [Candidatus Sumerlaeota bacterium]|nr:hypothetical protein [Candidatus Sumerlaeota bacterium]HOR28784.1 hypothetical protein [Candidatus Sumerlaeota bacterium]HPK03201.1 hypothetical protein [Candidatus Sumerlaeota bacterium]